MAAWRHGERRTVEFLGLFAAALIFVAIVVALADHAIAARLGRVPFEIDFVRSAKYLTPIVVIGLVWGAKLIWESGAQRFSVSARRSLVIAGGFAFLALNRGTLETVSQVSCGARTLLGLTCVERQTRADTTAMYRAIEREVPKGQLLFLTGRVGQVSGYGIRIYSRRPVAWSRKEGGILGQQQPHRPGRVAPAGASARTGQQPDGRGNLGGTGQPDGGMERPICGSGRRRPAAWARGRVRSRPVPELARDANRVAGQYRSRG